MNERCNHNMCFRKKYENLILSILSHDKKKENRSIKIFTWFDKKKFFVNVKN